jgi:hypothetical protein
MKIDEITQIKTSKEEIEVNEYLAKGYRIIKILSTKKSTDFGDEITPVFILGLIKS